ncbi:GNAT family N-acetyltransferase [Nocardioides aequoreus]|uniref:GNAT family N-acetyltransferase n=1 Tax=Nocardioides aequoreus TaxID=397278 RepID=UPI0004C32EE2|nr:GNAT family N-acetyltransferase [Nocardioides aequoreus]
MRVRVRRAEPDDLGAVVAFGSAVVPPHYAPILGHRGAQAQLGWWTAEQLAPALAAGRVHLAETETGTGTELVGVCQTGELDGQQVIWKLYVAPDHRGRSLGVELLQQAVAALPQGAESVHVEHFAGNAGAARFYEREGFEVVRTDPPSPGGSPGSAVVWRRRRLR